MKNTSQISLVFCVVDEGKSLIEAVVETPTGRRRIRYRWYSKGGGGGIPDDWWDTVLGEVDYQMNRDDRPTMDDIMSGRGASSD